MATFSRMWNAQEAVRKIGERVGLTDAQVYRYAAKLGLPRRSKRWAPEDDAAIRQSLETLVGVYVESFERTEAAVRNRMVRILTQRKH